MRIETETCDDGSNDTVGCNSTCTGVMLGYSCTHPTNKSLPSICNVICGDWILISPETCDDNNTINNDGCSSICQIEPNYFCNNSGNPSLKSNCSKCGDSKKFWWRRSLWRWEFIRWLRMYFWLFRSYLRILMS